MAVLSESAVFNRLRLKQLKLLVAIGEQGSLRRAAGVVHVTQPTATKMLSELELSLGFAVYERYPRGLQITSLGREVLNFANRVMADFDRMLTDVKALQLGGYGQLAVGAIMGATPDIIARAITSLKTEQPLLTVKLRGETSDHVLQLLEDRLVDVAVGRFSDLTQHNRYNFEPLGDEALCLVARPGHEVFRSLQISLADLACLRWIMQPLQTPARQLLEQEFARAGVTTPSDLIEANSILMIIQIVEQSDAIAMLSEPLVRDHLNAGLLVRVPLAIQARLDGFGIVTRRGEPLSKVVHSFIHHLRAAVAETAPRNDP